MHALKISLNQTIAAANALISAWKAERADSMRKAEKRLPRGGAPSPKAASLALPAALLEKEEREEEEEGEEREEEEGEEETGAAPERAGDHCSQVGGPSCGCENSSCSREYEGCGGGFGRSGSSDSGRGSSCISLSSTKFADGTDGVDCARAGPMEGALAATSCTGAKGTALPTTPPEAAGTASGPIAEGTGPPDDCAPEAEAAASPGCGEVTSPNMSGHAGGSTNAMLRSG